MKTEFIVNGGVSLLLSPENEMEEHLLKQMVRQENDLTEIRSNITILSKSYKSGVLLSRKIHSKTGETPITNEENSEDL